MKADLVREFTFEAAHFNRSAPPGAVNARVHGHSYRVVARIAGAVDERLGWVTDFADIKRNCTPVIDQLDHRLLNEIDGMTDTSRGDVERWLTERLKQEQPGFSGCGVSILGAVAWDPVVRSAGTMERIAFGFASAHFLPMLPKEHKCRRMHGHSFQIEVAGPDAARLIETIEKLYPQLDHRVLNEVDGLENPTSEVLARWLWEAITASCGTIAEVDVKETCTTSCRFRGQE
jgi:6-pyruvoyltetrahydropterin/6-carboxytetrahydropterin synthase